MAGRNDRRHAMTETNAAAPAADLFERERAAMEVLKIFQGDSGAPALAGYQQDAKGRLVPEELIPEHVQMEDSTVRTIAAYFLDLHRQIHRFIGHCYDDLHAFDDLLGEKYGLKRRGGAKGNRTYTSFDGTLKVVVQVQDRITFGPELAAARELVEECISEWAEGARAEIQALVRHAFEPDKEGQVNRESVFRLRKLEIDDPRWKSAQAAITDAIRVIGSASYIRCYVRANPLAPWLAITIDMNGAPLPETLAR